MRAIVLLATEYCFFHAPNVETDKIAFGSYRIRSKVMSISIDGRWSPALVVCLALTAPVLSQDQRIKTARDLVKVRQHHDRTVWSAEVDAQSHENTFVQLWDNLIHGNDRFRVLRQFEFDWITLPTTSSTKEIDHGIKIQTGSGEGKRLSHDDFQRVLTKVEEAGYKIIETEWHHQAFEPSANGMPASSTVSVLMHITHEPSDRRLVVRGNLELEWRSSAQQEKKKTPSTIDATGLRLYTRTGAPAFRQMIVETLKCDPQGKTAPTTLHPVMIRDLDKDGLPDVIVGGHNRVYRNKGNWNFEASMLCDVPVRHVNAGVMADFDGDGIDDYVAAGKNDYVYLIQGFAGGKFPNPGKSIQSIGKLTVPVSVAAGDIDGDGHLDLFIGQQKPGYANGDIPTPYYDATDSFPSFMLLNDGKGNFRDVTHVSGLGRKNRRRNFSASFVDLDDDSDLDLLLTSDFSGTDLFLNDGRGHFTDATESMQPIGHAFGMSHSFGDYNLDGQLDFITIGMSSTTARRLEKMNLGREGFADYNAARMKMGYGNRLFLRQGNGFRQADFNSTCARTGWSWGSTTLDFDRDGDQDIYIVNGQTSGKTTKDYCTRFWCHDVYYKRGERPDAAIRELFGKMAPLFTGNAISWNGYEHNALLMNLNGAGFENVGFLMNCAFEFDSRTAISGDLDVDGNVDLIVERKDRDNRRQLYFVKNNWPSNNHWIGVQLEPVAGMKTSPMGAKVIVTMADGRKLLQHCAAGHSVWAQHLDWIHFGTGGQSQVKQIEVRWPGGFVTRIANPEIDKYHVVKPSES